MTASQLAKSIASRVTHEIRTASASLTRPSGTPTYTANDVVGGPSAVVTFTSATPTVCSWAAHGLVAGDPVIFRTTGGTIAAGLTSETVYYAIIPVANPTTTIRLAATYADAVAETPVPLATTGTGTGTTVGAKVGSSVLVFAGMGNGLDGVEIKQTLLSLNLAAVPTNMAGMRLHLYSARPPSLLNDDDAWTLTAADMALYLGYIDLGTPVDCGPVLVVQATSVGRFVRTGGDDLYGYLVTAGNYAAAAGSVATVRLFGVAV